MPSDEAERDRKHLQEDLPELVVESDEVRTITAQRWEYSRVIIHPGGTLQVVPGSTEPLVLVSRGDFELHGTIEYIGADGTPRVVTLEGRPGVPLQLSYSRSMGGRGADGSARWKRGGRGADGTDLTGGGGGGGSSMLHHARGQDEKPGGDATGWQGGRPSTGCGNNGGNGGRASPDNAGGIIVIRAKGNFDGTGGLLHAFGQRGGDGKPGMRAHSPSSVHGCSYAMSGGGGGAPGGQGGFIIVSVDGELREYPGVNITGGMGGLGGTTPGNPAQDGNRGRGGAVYWYPSDTTSGGS